MALFDNIEKARRFLELGGAFYVTREEIEEWNRKNPDGLEDDSTSRTLNMNDTFGRALAYGELVSDEDMIEVAELFCRYGYHGLTYWCAEKEGWSRSEFEDITRGIEFVRQEEKIMTKYPDSSERAYKKVKYTLGG